MIEVLVSVEWYAKGKLFVTADTPIDDEGCSPDPLLPLIGSQTLPTIG